MEPPAVREKRRVPHGGGGGVASRSDGGGGAEAEATMKEPSPEAEARGATEVEGTAGGGQGEGMSASWCGIRDSKGEAVMPRKNLTASSSQPRRNLRKEFRTPQS